MPPMLTTLVPIEAMSLAASYAGSAQLAPGALPGRACLYQM